LEELASCTPEKYAQRVLSKIVASLSLRVEEQPKAWKEKNALELSIYIRGKICYFAVKYMHICDIQTCSPQSLALTECSQKEKSL
jgi:hypothetical protein